MKGKYILLSLCILTPFVLVAQLIDLTLCSILGEFGIVISFVLIPYLEELVKAIPLFLLLKKGEKDSQKYIVAGFTMATTFWILENILYGIQYGNTTLLIRFLIPLHIALMGQVLYDILVLGIDLKDAISGAYSLHLLYNCLCGLSSITPVTKLIFIFFAAYLSVNKLLKHIRDLKEWA